MNTPNVPFFMYGTLRPGGELHGWIERDLVSFQPGVASGRMYSLGEFPCVKFDQPGLVKGDICTIEVTMQTLAMIEMEMRAGYQLIEVPVYRRDEYGVVLGTDSNAWAFHYPYDDVKMLRVKGGDWPEFVQENPFHAYEWGM